MITHIKFVSIPTRDQDAALAFYTEKLGFRVITDQPFGPQRWIELRVGSSETRFVLFTPPGQEDRIGSQFTSSRRAASSSCRNRKSNLGAPMPS
jgi:catechol 2,3-dioxygenase-like lactoylglutathione lyase family enzyme